MKKILIIDNSSFMRLFVKKILERGDSYTVLEASNEEEGIKLFENEKPDIVILDLNISDSTMEGINVLTHIMKVSPETSVIIISAVRHEEIKQQCLELGAKSYIMKPFDTETLLKELV
ncbi:response regulator [Clostridium sp. 19966]|uniref:response regulator n=1 Tax=Clostridium sp. 19966 TaxID=2768166 RepID=UPI0028DFFA1E|nr:response regulator [Clostridium sp. 19966]MDT8719244.1 response regulator [Clostridium sp. 19966]